LAGTLKQKEKNMFGINMMVSHNEVKIRLRPLSKNDIPILTEKFSSMKVHLFTNGLFGQTLENEEEWYESRRKSDGDCIWAIQPLDSEIPIGVTGIHEIKSRENSCSSGNEEPRGRADGVSGAAWVLG
jgi:RimJ/RimL family protein N-acetyltransferase